MSLQVLRNDFSSDVQSRGRHYFAAGRVKLQKVYADQVTAIVRGTRRYTVHLLHVADQDFQYDCTCPYFIDRDDPCKHIWATVLEAQRQAWPPLTNHDLGSMHIGFGSAPLKPVKKVPSWKREFSILRERLRYATNEPPPAITWPENRRLLYVIDPFSFHSENDKLPVHLYTQEPRKNGAMGKPRLTVMTAAQWLATPDPNDRMIAHLLMGAQEDNYYGHAYSSSKFNVPSWAFATTVKSICQTGRCFLRQMIPDVHYSPLEWDDGPAWQMQLELAPLGGDAYQLQGVLRREGRSIGLHEIDLLRPGLFIAEGRISLIENSGSERIAEFVREHRLRIPASTVDELMRELYELPNVPPVRWPRELAVTETTPTPTPILKIKPPKKSDPYAKLHVELLFDYDGQLIECNQSGCAMIGNETRTVIRRNFAMEQQFAQMLVRVGLETEYDYSKRRQALRLNPARLPAVVPALVQRGWRVEAEGNFYRTAGNIKIDVSSGIDWFDLNAAVEFADQVISLPRLLAALKRGEKTIRLDDGTIGVLPEQWLNKYATLAALGEVEGDALRFSRSQAGFLDALLATMPEATCDELFQRTRNELREFSGVKAAAPPESFHGQLRHYQEDGLGWLLFLQRFGFGGCLADDMGLGKTVQVLALLERQRLEKTGTALVVAPKSLVFNWVQEARRFTPNLRVLDQTGAARQRDSSHLADYDLVLTTYGTLRRDVGYFKDFEFDYVILDEAQAIKNSSTQASKAARLLRARHRLTLTGTPVENHLSDLFSLFDFLNPGMLGSASVFKTFTDTTPDNRSASHAVLSQALRPFLLRRTKLQVAPELPERVEQTLYCELEPPQRKLYDELREHYRQSLLGHIDRVGIARSKIQILEALLRLRQAACHPGLIDKSRRAEPSAKLESLRQQLAEVLDEGHKALVFSQFTSLLSIVREDIERQNIPYEYLDGKTRDRQQRVEHFQSDPHCKLFLISLKAGGLGLNLTAADYVFLLDPWWNPAVEAQAIDRAHRIGQHRSVFAYRLIAKDTVEEKVLQLQQSKRALADAIITQDNSLISTMGRNELELLLS